jgi:hypothetical protein
MEAHWLRLSNGSFALVHKPVIRDWTIPPDQKNSSRFATERLNGHPVLPESDRPFEPCMPHGPSGLSSYEAKQVGAQVEELIRRSLPGAGSEELPDIDALALPPGPSPPPFPTRSVMPLHTILVAKEG